MKTFSYFLKNCNVLLALGGESAGNFTVFSNRELFSSNTFGDLAEEKNFLSFQTSVFEYLRKNKLKPTAILTDLHPFYATSVWGEKIARKFKADHIRIQHHQAHLFSQAEIFPRKENFYGITLDGTGYGSDEKIWGGEIFEVEYQKIGWGVQRIGQLENQTLLGGEIAVREPARVLLAILDKFLPKEKIYSFIKKYYSQNEFELLHNQLENDFNCLETSSAGRILDAASVLLGFSKNERKIKHGPTYLLEKNATTPYSDLQPKIISNQKNNFILSTTHLFDYLTTHLDKRDKKRLAATAQLYLAQGLHEIIKQRTKNKKLKIVLAGGLSENKAIADYFSQHKILLNPLSSIAKGDAGLSIGQINYFLNTRKPA